MKAVSTPRFCALDKIRPQGVAFHIPAHREQMIVILDGK
jgi:hypothetical protein